MKKYHLLDNFLTSKDEFYLHFYSVLKKNIIKLVSMQIYVNRILPWCKNGAWAFAHKRAKSVQVFNTQCMSLCWVTDGLYLDLQKILVLYTVKSEEPLKNTTPVASLF